MNDAVSKEDIVVQSEHLSDDASRWLADRCQLIVCPFDHPDFSEAIERASALVVRTYTIVDQELLARAPKLKVVGRAGVGLDNIDVAACRRRGIEVVYTPDANTQSVVEYVIALLCDALRPRQKMQHAVGMKEWGAFREEFIGRRQMDQLTLGILGLGRVGKRFAQVAGAIGFRVIYNDIVNIPTHLRAGAEPVDVRTLFERSDVVSIHIDGRSENEKFVSAKLIDRMRPDAIFLNTSRGLVVDNLALANWLRANAAGLAMLDVHDPEPFGADYPLLGLPNAWLYPHLASRTEAAMNNMSWVVKDVAAVLEGRGPEFPAPLQ